MLESTRSAAAEPEVRPGVIKCAAYERGRCLGDVLHDLALEDAHLAHQRPKVEIYDDSLFVVLRTVQRPTPEGGGLPPREFGVIGGMGVLCVALFRAFKRSGWL